MTTNLKERVARTLDFLRIRQRNYRQAFSSPMAQEMLIDLAKFCRADETCFDIDPRRHAALEGRREVWLRIAHHLHLTAEELFAIHSGRQFTVIKQGDDK